ncbi:helix-turn-helix domain-containing protein [Sporosarcina sp. ITBMC105]
MTMSDKKVLGSRLKKLRGKMTQEEVSKRLGLSRARYSHYENDRVEPDTELLKKIADFFEVTTDYLIGQSDDPRMTADQEFEAFANDPELERWYRELPESDEEDVRRLRDMWEIMRRDKR